MWEPPATVLLAARLAYLRHEVAAALSAKVLASDEEARARAERDERQLRDMAARAEEALLRARTRAAGHASA